MSTAANGKSINNVLLAGSFFGFTQARFFAGYYFREENRDDVRA